MKDDDFWVAMEPVEDGYGGGYRTRHIILKRRHASLAFSVYSCRLHDKVAPNRDYVSEGLCSFVNEEIFYNNELFSCDHGLVPSRDPVCWPSQWVDPYLER